MFGFYGGLAGASKEDIIRFAAVAAFGKFTDKTKTAGAANKGKIPGSDHKLSSGQMVSDFEKSLVKLPPGKELP